jgi:predicted transcriptional regulator
MAGAVEGKAGSRLQAADSPPDAAGPDDDLAHFDRAFGPVAFVANRFIVDHLLRYARQFGADYQMLVIWGVLAHQSVAHLLPMGRHPPEQLNQKGILDDPYSLVRPVRLRDLSQITGLPKETVRRKLEKLEKAGWICRREAGWVLLHAAIDAELREFSRETVTRLLTAAEDIRRLLRDTGR